MSRPSITPPEPFAAGVELPWDREGVDPVAALAAAREEHGDTFVVDSGDDRYLFTFSPRGVESFYRLPEEKASKGVADWRMLRRKLPPEVFAGRRTFPHDLFTRADVVMYLDRLQAALAVTIEEMGESGEVDVFALTRRLGHRIGLASWAGPGCAEGEDFDRLVEAFDALDGSEAFVHPEAMAAVAASGYRRERAALDTIREVMGRALNDLDGSGGDEGHPLFARIAQSWADESVAARREGVAMDVTLVHVASMSNLLAALGWALVDLAGDSTEQARIRSGDRARAEQCALESTRLAQRSIMSRYVLQPVSFDAGDCTYEVAPGVTIATVLPMTNLTAAPGLDRWEPDRWNRRRLADPGGLAAVELVTAFGHGSHTCPAQPFSLAAMSMALIELLGRYEVAGLWRERPPYLAGQIGGVGRPARECTMRYESGESVTKHLGP